MFNLFKKKKATITLAEYFNTHEKEFAEYDAAMQSLRDEERKSRFIIEQIYARHGINADADELTINDYHIDNEVLTDLHIFNEYELATLRKWARRFNEAKTRIDNIITKYYDVINSYEANNDWIS